MQMMNWDEGVPSPGGKSQGLVLLRRYGRPRVLVLEAECHMKSVLASTALRLPVCQRRLSQTNVTPSVTMAMPSQRLLLMRSWRKSFAPNAPAV